MALYFIKLSYATFGIETAKKNHKEIVTEAPPIARWMIGKSWIQCAEWINKKRGTVERVREDGNQNHGCSGC